MQFEMATPPESKTKKCAESETNRTPAAIVSSLFKRMRTVWKLRRVSYSKLRQNFTPAMGISLGQYHLFLRERLAVSLLRNSDDPIVKIADRLGFESNFYFSAFIKQRTGLSPRAWRLEGTRGTTPVGIESADDPEDKSAPGPMKRDATGVILDIAV